MSEVMSAEVRKAYLEHLTELRKILIWVLIVVGGAFAAIFTLCCDQLLDFLCASIEQLGIELVYTALAEAWVVKMKVALLAAIIATFPITSLLIWKFLRPALYPRERRSAVLIYLLSLLLFAGGVVFAWLAVFSLTVNFFIFMGENTAAPMISIAKYINFMISFMLPFGLIFLSPLISYVLSKLNILTASALVKGRKYIIFGIAVLAAVLTPPDVISQVMMIVPMLVLFEASVIICKCVERRAKKLALRAAGEL